jgi:uncharacterized protein YecE (DUF72 family)
VGLFVGTSGWAYKEWKPGFYPEDLPQKSFLDFYGKTLTACEVNATFYRMQSDSTFEKWGAAVPDQFRFAAKAHRRITHRKQFAPEGNGEQFFQAFLDSLTPLGNHLACVLFQFPPFVKRDDEQLGGLLDALPDGLRFTCEFRDESWETDEIAERVAAAGGTICVSETEGKAPDSLPPGPLAYIRIRAQNYSDEERDKWLALLAEQGAERDVFAFAKHEGIPAGDPYGGVGLAQWLVAQTS